MDWFGDASPVTPTGDANAVNSAVPTSSAACTQVRDPSEWIRNHARSCETRYRTWVNYIHASQDGNLKYRWCTDSELRKYGVPPRLPCEVPGFGTDERAPWLFTRAHPLLVPVGHHEWQEFNRRIFFLGISTTQGLELRRRNRDVGVRWP